jgi:predicted outer membrane protein
MSSTRRFSALTLAALMSLAAHGAIAGPSSESLEFASQAARSGAQVIESSKVAQRTSRDSRVRAFAARLALDHTQSNDALLLICRRKEIKLPTQPANTSMPESAGSTFDRVYSLEMSQHLAKMQALYGKAIEARQLDPELQAFARTRATIVREQARQADALARSQAGLK